MSKGIREEEGGGEGGKEGEETAKRRKERAAGGTKEERNTKIEVQRNKILSFLKRKQAVDCHRVGLITGNTNKESVCHRPF